MATWNQLIEDRMGDFTISSDASGIADANGVDQFLSDGILDIIERCRKYKPEVLPLFAYESSTGSTNNRELKNMDLLRVVAQFSSVKYPARYVTPDIFLKAGISGSIYEATNSDPIYTVRKKSVFVLPSGGEDYIFDVILPDPSVDAGTAASNTNPSNFPEDMHHLLASYGAIKVLEHILARHSHDAESAITDAKTSISSASTNIANALSKVNELFSATDDEPDIIDIQDALTKAKNLIDGSDMGDDSATAESVQFWLLDEDTDMVSSTISVASQELSRAGQIMAALDKKTAALSKYTEVAANYLQVAGNRLQVTAGYSASMGLLEKVISSLKVDYISYFSPAQAVGGGKNEA